MYKDISFRITALKLCIMYYILYFSGNFFMKQQLLAGLFALVVSGLSSFCVCAQHPSGNIVFGVIQNKVPVLTGKKDNPVIGLHIPVYGRNEPVLSEVNLLLKGTVEPRELKQVRLYYTGSSAVFSTRQLVASAAPAAGQISLKGVQKLQEGNHFFWVSVELDQAADLLHTLDLMPKNIVLNGKIQTAPADFAGYSQRIGRALRNAGDDKVISYRIPGLETTKAGTLIAVYDIRYNSSVDLQEDVDVGMSRSVDGGQSWEPMRVIMDMGKYGGKPEDQNGIGDPSVLVDRQTGDIWVAALWLHGYPKQRAWNASQPGMEPSETGQLMLSKSSDDGQTWSSPINITRQVKDPSWRLCFQGPGRGITMADGTLVFPAQYKDSAGLPHATILCSKDHGQTWKMGKAAYPNTTEAQVVEPEPGTVMLNMRDNRGGFRTICTTRDLGETWTEHPSSRSALREPVCNASIIKHVYHGKPILFFVNPDAADGRHHMTIKASMDGGLSWPLQKQLLLDELRGSGYPSLTMIDEEHIGIVYEGSQADLVFEKVAVKEILGR